MRFAFNEEQELIRESAADLASRLSGPADFRAFADGNEPFSARLWQGLADGGFTAVLIPPAHGGSALGMVEAGSVLEVLGR
jgi:alkylation response protein AidB-like acyl-CoA dehydrogenase